MEKKKVKCELIYEDGVPVLSCVLPTATDAALLNRFVELKQVSSGLDKDRLRLIFGRVGALVLTSEEAVK